MTKEQIINIFKSFEHDAYFGADCSIPASEYELVADEILRLYSVSGRSEQLKAFDELFDYAWNLAQHPEEHAKLNDIKERF